MASLKSGTTIGGYTAIHTNNISSYALTSAPSVSQLISPNGGTVVGADQAMPSAGHSFIHTLALGPSNNDGHILGMTWSNTTSVYGAQIFIDTDPTDTMAIRSRSNAGVWTSWKTIIHSGNIGSQSVSYATSAGNSSTTSQIVFSDLKTNFPSGAGGGHSFASNHYSMGLDSGNGGWDSPHYRDLIIGYHTGIRIGAAYSGIRFYDNSPTTDANNDGNGDGGEKLLMTIGGYVGTANQTDVVVNNNLFANVSMRAPIFYDSNDTGYYLDPNGTSNLLQLTTATRARWNMPRVWYDRSSRTSDQGYWTGTNGWGASDGTWANAWQGGFSGWDIWGEGIDHPQSGQGYVHAQGIVSGQHYATSSVGYGWMMVGAHNAAANRYWLRGKWDTTTSSWVEMITTGNIGSQSVNYATSAGSANSVTWSNVSGKPSLDYQQEYTFTAPASTDGSGYSWVRVSMGGFNAGGDFVRFSIARAIYWNGSSPYGGPSMDVVAYSREWHGGQEGAVITYGEHGSVPGSGWVTNAGPRDLAGGGYWFYMRIWGGVDYVMRVYRGSGPIGTSWESTSDPGSVFALRVGVNNIGSTHTGFNTTGPIYGSTLYNGTNAVIHAGNIASQSVSYADESGFASSAGSVEWTSVQNKPATFPPSSHTHDDRYYTESESDGRFFYAISSQLANTNLNDLTTRGVYYSAGQYGTNSNIPFANYFTMINLTNDVGRQAQLWFGDTPGTMYWRPRQGDSTQWHPWEKVITTNNIGSQSVNYANSAGDSTNLGGYSSARYVRNDIYNSVDAGLQVFRNIGTIDGSWPSSDHTLGLENSDAGTIVVNFHRAGYTSNNLWYNGSQFRFDTVVSSTADFRAPIFYDSNDTTYYGDFASTSYLRHLSVGDVNASNDGSWNARLNLTGSSHARLDVKSNSDGIITTMYSHTGQGVGRVGTMSNHPLAFMVNGSIASGLIWDSTNGSRFVVGESISTPYTLIDSNKRPVIYARGAYPVLTLDHTETGNNVHGPTIQFVHNGLDGRQFVIGTNGYGTQLDFGYSDTPSYGNTSYNPHNGIGGYNGKTIMRLTTTGLLVGDAGTYPTVRTPARDLDVRGSQNISGVLNVNGATEHAINDNTRVVGSSTNNTVFINGSIQLTSNNDAIVIGRGTATFLSDEELGFGWGGGWYMTEGSYIRSRGSKSLHMNGGSVDYVGSIYIEGSGTYAHLQPNSGSYGTLQVTNSKNGWAGIRFTAYNTNIMSNANESGFYHNDYGWQIYWYNGTLYCYKNANGGGTQATVLDSSNAAYAWNMNQYVRTSDSPTFQSLFLPQNPVGSTYGNGVSATPPNRIEQRVGDNDGWRIYGEAGATNEVRMVFELIDDIETAYSDQWVFRNKLTYSSYTARNEFQISGDGDAQARGSMRAPIFYSSVDTNYFWEPNVSSAHRFRTANGYVDIGPMNSSWCHFQTDRANFYFGSTIYADASGFATYGGSTSMTKTDINSPIFLVPNHSDNTKGYRIYNTSNSSVSAMFVNSSNQLVIAAGAVDQINLNKKVYVNGVALGVNVAPSATAGRIDASNDIVAYSTSDERFKENITPIPNALDKVKTLTGVEFDWRKETKDYHGYVGHDVGVIAQQVKAVLPEAVRTNANGYLAVRYEKLIGLLIEANKELAARVEELEKKLG